VPGEEVKITSEIINRSGYPYTLKKIETTGQLDVMDLNQRLEKESFNKSKFFRKIPGDAEYSQPLLAEENPVWEII